MAREHTTDAGERTPRRGKRLELVPREYLRIIAVWSLVPSYLLAGGFLGYLVDSWLGIFPYGTAAGLLFALVIAVRDMMRLRDEM